MVKSLSKRSRWLSPPVRGGLIAALVLAMGLSPFASSAPDGLERVAERLGFAGAAAAAQAAPLPDYAVTALQGDLPLVSTALAGAIGTVVAFFVAWLVARSLTPAGRES